MTIGNRLIKIRKSLDINQTEMAMTLGCSQVNISQYEQDKTTMSVKYLLPLRNAYDVNIDWLLTGIGPMFLTDSQIEQTTDKSDEIDKLKTELETLKKEYETLKKENNENKEVFLQTLKKVMKTNKK